MTNLRKYVLSLSTRALLARTAVERLRAYVLGRGFFASVCFGMVCHYYTNPKAYAQST